MEALSRVPLSEQAARALLDDVRRGRWEVGEQLPGEVSLARELSVGRSTVREAIRRLAARGVLTTRQGVGVFLAATEPTQPWDQLAEIAEITDVLQVRIAIESRAAALAAANHTDDDARIIRTALENRNALLDGTPQALAAEDIRLHQVIVVASHNDLLVTLFDGLRARLVGSMTDMLTMMPVGRADADEHSAVVDAILARDSDRAERLTRAHLLGLADSLGSDARTEV
ncbi:FadR/GntR family transcriptional regulator [Gordonia aichiensis]